jgi:hypothetical protein
MLAQVNVVAGILSATAPQLSVEPPSISPATIETLPVPSKYALMF